MPERTMTTVIHFAGKDTFVDFHLELTLLAS
jgi:hypothetical protein